MPAVRSGLLSLARALCRIAAGASTVRRCARQLFSQVVHRGLAEIRRELAEFTSGLWGCSGRFLVVCGSCLFHSLVSGRDHYVIENTWASTDQISPASPPETGSNFFEFLRVCCGVPLQCLGSCSTGRREAVLFFL